MLRVPSHQKRRFGRGRYLIRRYLSQFLPQGVFDAYRKDEGLGIVPATFDLFQQQFEQNRYQEAFKNLPYQHLIQHPHPAMFIRNHIKGYMLGRVITSHGID